MDLAFLMVEKVTTNKLVNKANSGSKANGATERFGNTAFFLKNETDSAKKTVEQAKKRCNFHKAKLNEAKKCQRVAYNLSVMSADENVLDSKLKLIDQEADLENLWAVLNTIIDLFSVSFGIDR